MKPEEYEIVIKKSGNNYSAYSPELPGVFTVGDTETETYNNMLDAIEFYIEELIADGLPVPTPHCQSDMPSSPEPLASHRVLLETDLQRG